MPQTEKYTIKDNEDNILTLKTDKPQEGEGKFGKWYLYNVTHQGKDFTFFPSEALKNRMEEFKEGDTVNIVKYVDGGKFSGWKVTKAETNGKMDYPVDEPIEDEKVDLKGDSEPNWDIINGVKTFNIQIQVAAKLSAQSMKEFDKDRAAELTDDWMHILTDNYSRAYGLLKRCKNDFDLQACWHTYMDIWDAILSPEEMAFLVTSKEELRQQDDNKDDDLPF
jgi:hypothetical protein